MTFRSLGLTFKDMLYSIECCDTSRLCDLCAPASVHKSHNQHSPIHNMYLLWFTLCTLSWPQGQKGLSWTNEHLISIPNAPILLVLSTDTRSI